MEPVAKRRRIWIVDVHDRVVSQPIGNATLVPMIGWRMPGCPHKFGVLGVGDGITTYPILWKKEFSAGLFVLVGFRVVRRTAHPERSCRYASGDDREIGIGIHRLNPCHHLL
jgi:hypothetical protein